MHSMDTTDNPTDTAKNAAMKHPGFVAAPLLALSLLASAGAEANEYPPHDLPLQLAQNQSAEERAALREQLGNRMREISPAEQSLMRDSAYDGRKRIENGEEARTEQRGGRNEGGYGRGLESRQGGGGMGGGGGRGTGGGRGR
ncbi:hypothetical protein SCD_n00404 [Sulfuricella denitrificans skB26]|uniref:Uncharacterized protein n=2 Tax=Sulfuricella denitrificans TaxID=649841 RepID=S6AB30_SULDS|nr:hypothetical protein SCD_n00404 [Sulfuricella denitrificans skB26]